MFKLGDFVRFVDEKREGYVTRIIDSNTLGVTDTDGFEIPVHRGNLTYVHGQNTAELTNDDKPNFPEKILDPGLFLIVAGDKKAGAVVHFYLFNRSSNIVLTSVTSEQSKVYKGEYVGILQSKAVQKIYSASLAELDMWPYFTIQILQHTAHNEKPKEPLVFEKRFRAKDFSDSRKLIVEIGSEGWMIQLDKSIPLIDPQKLKESFFRPQTTAPIVSKPDAEVDLHIEMLRDDFQKLSKEEIFNFQLDYFDKMISAAIVHKMPSIVFIHGVGNGVLQNNIHKLLGKHPQVRTFKDGQKQKFGYGATEVIFK